MKIQVISRSLTTLPWGPHLTFLSPSQGQVHPVLCLSQPQVTPSPWIHGWWNYLLYQPLVGYFTFIQNNLAQITSGNTLQVMREAEQRHLQITHGVVDSIKNDWLSRLAMQEQEHEQRLQDAEAKAITAIAEERKRGDELEVRLNQAHATHDARVEEFKVEANTKHDLKIAEERQRQRNSKPPMHKRLSMLGLP